MKTMTTKNRLVRVLTCAALVACAGCNDLRDRQDSARDREDSAYRAALADYRAGRLDAAVKGFAKAIRKSPANASARFQYACLMQDTKKDFLEAYCAYREFLMQRPDSDKAKLAEDRLAICERELAKEFAEKHRLLGNEAFEKEISTLRASLKAAESRAASAEKLLEDERTRTRALEGEHERLLAAVKGTGDGESDRRQTSVDVKDLLDEEEDETGVRDAALAKETAAVLKAEEAAETASGPSMLPKRTDEDVVRREAAQAVHDEEVRAANERVAAERARHPPTYVVQEGDTLYKIALRFYGRVADWRKIRNANRAIISNDGRVKAGQTIKLP